MLQTEVKWKVYYKTDMHFSAIFTLKDLLVH